MLKKASFNNLISLALIGTIGVSKAPHFLKWSIIRVVS